MKCIYHKKDVTHQCIWCGRQICELCIGQQDGRKIYCHKCLEKVGTRRARVPLSQATKEPEYEHHTSSKSRMEDGYLVLGGSQ